jgi:hypothetical protein
VQTGIWKSTEAAIGFKYNCGYCGTLSSPSSRYICGEFQKTSVPYANILICSNCNQPTYISEIKTQTPGPIIGREIGHLPIEINNLYDEARKCITVGAHTSAILSCRKILMNVAVQEGAEEDKNFQFYVNYLESNNYLPPKGKGWVDKIRKKGNEATHEIAPMSLQDATELIGFVEMLLTFVYEFPGMVGE